MASQPIANPTIDWTAKNLALEYQNFVELCDLMFIGPHKGLDDGEKFSYMVLWGGAKALQLWRNAGMSVKSVKNLQQVLKDYCVPSELKFWANRMEMRHITQKPNETFQDYTVRVMALADTCEWKDKDEQIICALIFGANHRDGQRKALSKPKDIKLKDVIDHFASFEATDAYHKLLSANNSSDTTDVNRIKKTHHKNKSSSTNFINCYSCGSNHKYGDCPAYGHICKTCGRRNHLESMCRSKNDKPSHKSNPKHKQSDPQKSHNRGHGHKLNQVNADSSDCEDEHDAYSYVYKINSAKSSDEFVKLRFLNSKVGAMATVDTGAEVSVLPVRVYKQLYPKSVDSNGKIQGLDACNMKLTAFNLTNINVMGQIRLPVKHRDVMKNIKFIVTNIDTATVIGRNDAVDLHCVEFLCHNCDQCNDDDSICIKSLSTPDNCKNDLHYSEKCQIHAGAQANDCSMNYSKPANFPMHRVGTDLFEFNGKQFLVMVDHYSSYPWVRRLRNTSSASCIDAIKSVFSEFGYPQHIHSSSGRQYSSQEFNSFVHEFNVKHTMFNAECYVGTMKRILKKCDNIYDALHAYRSIPLYNSRYSPFELLFNRRMKDNVISLSHFEPGTQKPTQVNSELGIQKPLQRNSELGPQKPPQGNFELGPQKPPQGNFEPVTQKPICELLPPQPEADTSDSSVVEEQALTGPDVINIPDPHVLRRSSRVDRRKPSRYKDYEL